MSKQIKSLPILLINRDLIVVSVLKIALIFFLVEEKKDGLREKRRRNLSFNGETAPKFERFIPSLQFRSGQPVS